MFLFDLVFVIGCLLSICKRYIDGYKKVNYCNIVESLVLVNVCLFLFIL